MRITTGNNIYTNNKNMIHTQYAQNAPCNSTAFKGGNMSAKLSKFFTLPNNKLKTYSIADYKNLTEYDKKILRFEYKCSTFGFGHRFYKNTEALHDGITDCMKSALDKKYGESNYVVITIGRSLSSIGKVLGYKIGKENIINVPLSNANKYKIQDTIDRLKDSELDGLKQYLNSLGLTKDKINKSAKKYILTDFCFTGQSLKGTEKLFKSDKLFGQDANICTEDIYSLIPDSKDTYSFKRAAISYLYESKFKQYSFVEKNTHLSDTQNAIKNPQKVNKTTRLMWFKLLDNFMRGKKADKTTLNNINACYPYLE